MRKEPYTATQMAEALGRTSRGLRKALANTPSDTVLTVKGKETAAWYLESLPKNLWDALSHEAQKHGHLSIERLINYPKSPWAPTVTGKKVNIRDLQQHCIESAKKLQAALCCVLPMLAGDQLTREEIVSIGLRDYKAVFGHEISPKHWWKLAIRTLERDRGFEDYERLEIYLSEKLALKKPTKPKANVPPEALARLETHLQTCLDLERPTRDEKALIWDSAFTSIEDLIDSGVPEADARKAVVAAIHNSGAVLSKNSSALKRNLNRKFDAWLKSGGEFSSIQDKRPISSGNHRAPELPEDDKKIIVASIVESGFRVAQGWRTALQSGRLSYATTQRFIHNPANKSHVPHSIRNAVEHEVKLLRNIHHGPHQHRMKGAYVTRDWSDCSAGDWFQGDDATMNHYYWEETDQGVHALRGQALFFVDIRSDYILGFCLHSERGYNARIIREAIINIHDSYGLPRQGFYFERGIWKKSKLLTGDKRGDETPWAETEQGLREFCQFRHAVNPRSKVVERVIGDLQNRTEPLPGYAGRNEMTEGFERFKKKMLKAKSGKIDYSDFLMSKEQWVDELAKACEAHNEDHQMGRIEGMSPRQAYEHYFNYCSPLMRLDGPNRYLLANHRKPMKVTRNGIRLTFKGQSHYYRNEATGALQGKEVLVWYETDQAIPDVITITDLNRKNPISVPLEILAPAMASDSEQLNDAMAQAEAHNKYARTLYRTITPHFTKLDKMFRKTVTDAGTRQLGEQITQDLKQAKSTRSRIRTTSTKLLRAERKHGIDRSKMPRNPERALRAMDEIDELLSD